MLLDHHLFTMSLLDSLMNVNFSSAQRIMLVDNMSNPESHRDRCQQQVCQTANPGLDWDMIYNGSDLHPMANGSVIMTDNQNGLMEFAQILHVYMLPIVIIVGVLGNTVSIIVFTITQLKKQCASVHLAALAISDTGFLLTLFINWLSWVGVKIANKQPWCTLMIYLTYVCSFLSVWIVVAFTVERFIVVCFPLRRRHILRMRRAKAVVSVISVFAILAYSFLFWTTGIIRHGNKNYCMTYAKFQRALVIITHIDTVVTLVVPSFGIITLNSMIFIAIYRASKTFNRTISTQRSYYTHTVNHHDMSHISHDSNSTKTGASMEGINLVVTTNNHVPRDSLTIQSRRQMKSTKMLLIISSVFVLLNLPSHAFRIRLTVLQLLGHYRTTLHDQAIQQLLEFIYYVNFAINFFLYSLCGENFRRCFMSLVKDIKLRFCKLLGLVSGENEPTLNVIETHQTIETTAL